MHCCNLSNCMSSISSTARLIAVCQKEQITSFDRRQIPINIDDNLIMKLQVNDSCLTCDHHCCNKKEKNYGTFIQAYHKLTAEELNDALGVPISQIKEYILRNVPCVGCRTSIDSFIKSLIEYEHPGLEPLLMDGKGSITIQQNYSSNPDNIYILFYIHGSKLNTFIESIPKSKKNRRCIIHSLERSKSLNDWEMVWDVMNQECHDQITLVEAHCLLDTIETYLRKYKFCSECKLKVLEAYDLLFEHTDCNHEDKKGFCPALYEGLRSCPNDRHIHIDCQKDFIGGLISRAELEIQDGRRERHAKTLDIAQEEILTCIGIYLFERFEKIYRIMRSEEQTWQLLFYIGIDCLRLNFETVIDRQQDFSMRLDILCEEFRLADQMKVPKKRSKRKARRQVKTNETTKKLDETPLVNEHKYKERIVRRRTSSCCSCLCHYYDHQSDSLLITHGTIPKSSLTKSHSCPSSLLFTSESNTKPADQLLNTKSSSLETLFSSISTRECICHEKNLEKQQVLCDECPISSSASCIRCFSTRTDLGYSSGQDEICSSGLCECSSTACDGCSTEVSHCCPLHEEDESSASVLSSGIYSHNCCLHDVSTDSPKTIELYDTTGKHKLQLQLSRHYPFFDMDLKSTWDENCSINKENQVFISDADLYQFSMLNQNFHRKRAQLRENLHRKFQSWKQRLFFKI